MMASVLGVLDIGRINRINRINPSVYLITDLDTQPAVFDQVVWRRDPD